MRWLTITLLLFSLNAFGWGNRGHEMITEMGNSLAEKSWFDRCHVSGSQLVEHSTDPDMKWRRDRRRHPDEAQAHFFHVDAQPENWKQLQEPKDLEQGYLVYRLVLWMKKAKEQRKAEQWDQLQETLFGLSHYVGDLMMPLHLTKNHDGEEFGLPDLHKQWETRMVQKYQNDLKALADRYARSQKATSSSWVDQDWASLINVMAEQSYGKVNRLVQGARDATVIPVKASRRRKESKNEHKMRFSKPLLFEKTKGLAGEQLGLGALLWAETLRRICGS